MNEIDISITDQDKEKLFTYIHQPSITNSFCDNHPLGENYSD